MIQRQLKLKLNRAEEARFNEWLPILGGVWNWAVRKIELNAANKIYFSRLEFKNLLAGHSVRVGVPSHTMHGVLNDAYRAWERCFKKIGRKPRLKGVRRPMNSIPFTDTFRITDGRAHLQGFGKVRFHKQSIPAGKIKCGRVCKRASGWYLCLFIEAEPNAIERLSEGAVGVDPGFKDLLTLSTGEVIENPREFEQGRKRLAQAQRGKRKRLTARLHERMANRRRDRNHKLSRRLVAEFTMICFLKDNHRGVAKKFGKSVNDSAHGLLREMLAYKSLIGGTELIFPENRNSTRTCSSCGSLSGPHGLAGLKVREWDCGQCGSHHSRDVNAAKNALILGAGSALGFQAPRAIAEINWQPVPAYRGQKEGK